MLLVCGGGGCCGGGGSVMVGKVASVGGLNRSSKGFMEEVGMITRGGHKEMATDGIRLKVVINGQWWSSEVNGG